MRAVGSQTSVLDPEEEAGRRERGGGGARGWRVALRGDWGESGTRVLLSDSGPIPHRV